VPAAKDPCVDTGRRIKCYPFKKLAEATIDAAGRPVRDLHLRHIGIVPGGALRRQVAEMPAGAGSPPYGPTSG